MTNGVNLQQLAKEKLGDKHPFKTVKEISKENQLIKGSVKCKLRSVSCTSVASVPRKWPGMQWVFNEYL